jgi:hypothetical protein
MVSEETRDDVFSKMREDAENLRCFDCDASDPQWASVTFGVFICDACAGIHRDLGQNISFVRSLRYDVWNLKQLKVMTAGGNRACQQFFAAYGMQKQTPAAFKLKTKAAQYYAQLISAVAEGQPCNAPAPAMSEALQMADLYPSFEPAPSAPPQEQGGGLFSQAWRRGGEVGGKLLGRINEASQHPTVKKVEDTTVAALSALETRMRQGTERIAQSSAFQSAKEKASKALHDVGESAAYQTAKTTASSAAQSVSSSVQGLYNRLWNKPAAPPS